ncbi:MAG: SOS response-associated peptidase [Actinobacteria bacterium]|nr:SOS response-associated peptidase [Actinomycetota bacterium]
MCGRFVSTHSPQQLADYFSVDELAATDTGENFNVSPTQSVTVVVEEAVEDVGNRRILDAYHWGLIPFWAKDRSVGNRMINARAETVTEKPAYRKAFERRRCLIPADGFYEWKKSGKQKQPYFIHPNVEPVFAFAGLWERWHDKAADASEEGADVRSCTIITGLPNSIVAPIHDRMPVVLPREHWDAWLDPENDDVEALKKLLVPAPAEAIAVYPVRTQVNSPRNNRPDNLDPDPNPVA